jgi:hypothetical protein
MTLGAFDLVHDALSWLGQLDAAAWVLIGLTFAVGFVIWRGVLGRARLGTIDVEQIQANPEAKLDTLGATAELQRELSKVGLLPAAGVPAGSPTAGLVAAIESAPIGEAKWLAQLISMLPIPPWSTSFRITSTMCANSSKTKYHLTYKVVGVTSGACLDLDTVEGTTPSKVLRKAANAIYRTIVRTATDLYPVWAHWTDPEALEKYQEGLAAEPAKPGEDVQAGFQRALQLFLESSRLDPKNMLVRLRIGNCLERLAGCERLDPEEHVSRWIEAVKAYEEVISLRPEMVQPRFRTSVVLGVLADNLDGLTADLELEVDRLLDRLGAAASASDDRAARLRNAARSESKQAWIRLRPWWTILHEGRLRHQFEPTGTARRQLRKALAMSFLCLRMRRIWDGKKVKWGLPAIPRGYWRLWAEWRYLKGRWHTMGWQAHYNAAAFYALLPQASMQAEASIVDDDAAGTKRIRETAFRHLEAAINDPDHDLRPAYVREEDLDLEVLRRAEEPTWQRRVVDRLCGRELVLHYQRTDKAYDKWQLSYGLGQVLTTAIQPAPLLRHTRVEMWGAIFRVPIYDPTKCVEFALVNGSSSDGLKRTIIPASYQKPEIWIVEGQTTVHDTQPA